MDALRQALSIRTPAVLLLAVDFPGLGGAAGIRELRRLSPSTKIIALSPKVSEEQELAVLRMGARGYCGPVEGDVLLKMIDKVQRGEVWAARKAIGALLEEFYGGAPTEEQSCADTQFEHLTTREREILRLLAEGASNKEIAKASNVAVSTVKAHLTRMFRKLGQPDRLRLALYAAAQPRSLDRSPRRDA
jgi:DNA-binding NarL/FixJ family response regulator